MGKFLIIVVNFLFLYTQNIYSVKSPNQKLEVTTTIDKVISFKAILNDELILSNVEINPNFDKLRSLGKKPVVLEKEIVSISDIVKPVIPYKHYEILDNYTLLRLKFKQNYMLELRVYNSGVAYRLSTSYDKNMTVIDEKMSFQMNDTDSTLFAEENSMVSHYERSYIRSDIGSLRTNAFASLPLYLKTQNNTHVVFTESDVIDYPNMFIQRTATGFQSKYPKVVKEIVPMEGREDRYETIIKNEKFIAETNGTRTLPWRIFIMSQKAGDLIENELVFLLASKNTVLDYSWIKPGKVAWDWWNANNITGVDFESGINLNTYKYYVDFASKYGLEYVILDEGWSQSTTDIKMYKDDLNVEELVAYAKEKNVGIILWVLWKPLDADMENILALYKKWGVKGVKIDFMQRADQAMVNFYERSARIAAKNHLIVDYHGAFKPTGLHRKYPNILNYEGVKGMEHVKWSKDITPEHNLTIPFVRMVAGPMDYTPGAMDNAHENHFAIRFNRPMSMGTRAHQVAMYVIYEAPLQMLADSPTHYERESETTSFIASIPTTWDNTVVLESEVSSHILILRQKDDNIYIAAMTNSKPRTFNLNLSFLEATNYELIEYKDGVNAEKHAQDYAISKTQVNNTSKLQIHLARGGGWVGILSKKK